jgi:ribosomal protein S18 acetylase RimI-like enzyme
MELAMQITTRRLTPDDAATLGRVAAEVFDAPLDRKRLAAYLSAPGHFMLVALAGGEVVAQVAAVIHRHPDKPTELYIDEVGVTPAWRRRGIARRMLEEMFEIGRAEGCEEAWVGTEHDNHPARGLYVAGGAITAEPFVMYTYDL